MKTKLFMNGRSQVAKLLKEYCLEGDGVSINKIEDTIIVTTKTKSWDNLFLAAKLFSDDFMEDYKLKN